MDGTWTVIPGFRNPEAVHMKLMTSCASIPTTAARGSRVRPNSVRTYGSLMQATQSHPPPGRHHSKQLSGRNIRSHVSRT